MAHDVHIDDIRPILRRERQDRDIESPSAVALVRTWAPRSARKWALMAALSSALKWALKWACEYFYRSRDANS